MAKTKGSAESVRANVERDYFCTDLLALVAECGRAIKRKNLRGLLTALRTMEELLLASNASRSGYIEMFPAYEERIRQAHIDGANETLRSLFATLEKPLEKQDESLSKAA